MTSSPTLEYKRRDLTPFSKTLDLDQDYVCQLFTLLPCPFCGSKAELKVFPAYGEDAYDRAYINCSAHLCDLAVARVEIKADESDEVNYVLVTTLVDSWNRRHEAPKPDPSLRRVPDDVLMRELQRRLSRSKQDRPADAIGYVHPSRTPDGKYTLSFWGAENTN